MPDAIFDEPRLAGVYDHLEGDRGDLVEYERILLEECGARSVLDIGCGTGTLALRLAGRGVRVTALDPAGASVGVARRKPGAEAVEWIVGDVGALPAAEDPRVDAVTMTANVAQVFLTDEEWLATLAAARAALRPGGLLVFEARRPEDRAWERWTKAATRQVVTVPGAGDVEDWVEVSRVDGAFVTFDSPTLFHADGARYESTTTLRFRGREQVEESLRAVGLEVVDVRDLAYAPGRAWLYLARRPAEGM